MALEMDYFSNFRCMRGWGGLGTTLAADEAPIVCVDGSVLIRSWVIGTGVEAVCIHVQFKLRMFT